MGSIPAPVTPESPAIRLWESLQEVRGDEQAVELIEQAFDRVGDSRAAEAMFQIFSRIGGGKRGAEMKAALLGIEGSGQTEADRLGVTRQTFHKNIERLRKKLLKPKNV